MAGRESAASDQAIPACNYGRRVRCCNRRYHTGVHQCILSRRGNAPARLGVATSEWTNGARAMPYGFGFHWFDLIILVVMLVVLALVAAIVFWLVASARQKWHNTNASTRR